MLVGDERGHAVRRPSADVRARTWSGGSPACATRALERRCPTLPRSQTMIARTFDVASPSRATARGGGAPAVESEVANDVRVAGRPLRSFKSAEREDPFARSRRERTERARSVLTMEERRARRGPRAADADDAAIAVAGTVEGLAPASDL